MNRKPRRKVLPKVAARPCRPPCCGPCDCKRCIAEANIAVRDALAKSWLKRHLIAK